MNPELVSVAPAIVVVAGAIAAALAARLARPLQPVRVKASRGNRRR